MSVHEDGRTSTVGRILVDAMRSEGVTHAFSVPGESFLGILDAFNDVRDVQVVATHHEEGAGFMAEAMAQATGRPGVVLVTRGPGAAHLSAALHAATQDSVPIVAVAGQVHSSSLGREAFQELDLLSLGWVLGKASMEIREPARAAELIGRAFYIARAGRPGPVLVSIPEDVANASSAAPRMQKQRIPVPGAREEDISAAVELIRSAGSVALVAGGGVTPRARSALVELADEIGCTVYTAFRRFDVFPNDHLCYAGNLPWLASQLAAPLLAAEVLLAIGTRLGDFSSVGYRLPTHGQQLIQVSLDPLAMSVMRSPDVGILADVAEATSAILTRLRVNRPSDAKIARRRRAAHNTHRAYLRSTTHPETASAPGVLDLRAAITTIQRALPPEAAIVSDAGQFSAFLNRYFRWNRALTFFGTTSGAMGYAVPAAIGVKLADPGRPVVALAGDGGFLMTMSEIKTATRLGLGGLVYVVCDNGTYGTIRLHQQRAFPGREIAVDHGSADLAAVSRGLGADSSRVTSTSKLASAIRFGLTSPRPYVVHAIVDPTQLDAWHD